MHLSDIIQILMTIMLPKHLLKITLCLLWISFHPSLHGYHGNQESVTKLGS